MIILYTKTPHNETIEIGKYGTDDINHAQQLFLKTLKKLNIKPQVTHHTNNKIDFILPNNNRQNLVKLLYELANVDEFVNPYEFAPTNYSLVMPSQPPKGKYLKTGTYARNAPFAL